MANSDWYTIPMRIKPVKETEQACLIKVIGIVKFKGWVVWLPKGCIKDRYTLILHKNMVLKLFVPTMNKTDIRQEHELTAKEFYQFATKDYSDDDDED